MLFVFQGSRIPEGGSSSQTAQSSCRIWRSQAETLRGSRSGIGAIVVLFPTTAIGSIRHVNTIQFSMLAFCCLNTLIAYGAFAEGLKHWEVSRFGAVLATAPLFTVAAMRIVGRFTPDLVAPERLNALSILGTLLVVAGSVTCAVARPGE